ncbi:hypothetical protein BC941DRAFT_518460 [Chlamydoabsidia padenii]|nr:hypothetical protein BC941DRAFT_518460 [Chlamydoabsidia padenii]
MEDAPNLIVDNDLLQLMGFNNQDEVIQPRTDYEGMSVKEIIIFKKRFKQQQMLLQHDSYSATMIEVTTMPSRLCPSGVPHHDNWRSPSESESSRLEKSWQNDPVEVNGKKQVRNDLSNHVRGVYATTDLIRRTHIAEQQAQNVHPNTSQEFNNWNSKLDQQQSFRITGGTITTNNTISRQLVTDIRNNYEQLNGTAERVQEFNVAKIHGGKAYTRIITDLMTHYAKLFVNRIVQDMTQWMSNLYLLHLRGLQQRHQQRYQEQLQQYHRQQQQHHHENEQIHQQQTQLHQEQQGQQ